MNYDIVISILIFYAILVVVNIPAPFIGLKFENAEKPKISYAPPGFIIPLVWFVLFTLLGIARSKLVADGNTHFQWWLFALALLCASYAYYTLGLAKITQVSALWFGLWGNIVVILFATIVALFIYPINSEAALLTIPVIGWTVYASIIVLGEMKLEKLI
jgi:tryptophan-rich sensory protein